MAVSAAASLAKVTVSVVTGGWAGLGAGALTEAVDFVAQRLSASHAVSQDKLIACLEKDLSYFALVEKIDADEAYRAFVAVEQLFRNHGLDAAELIEISIGSVDCREAAETALSRTLKVAGSNPADLSASMRSIFLMLYRSLIKNADQLLSLATAYRSLLHQLDEIRSCSQQSLAFLSRVAGQSLVVLPLPVLPTGSQATPTTLLKAQNRIVPFSHRDELVREIQDWAEAGDKEDTTVRLYTGQGGIGKTRLFLEVCVEMKRNGWHAGFYPDSNRAEKPAWAIEGMLQDPRDLFLVFDYADSRISELLPLLIHVAQSQAGAPKRRIVLLARATGDWWEQIRVEGNGIDELLDRTAAIPVPPLEGSLKIRQEIFHEAAGAFMEKKGMSKTRLNVPDLSSPTFSNFLFVHLGALAGIEGQRLESREKLLSYAANRERRSWRHTAKNIRGIRLSERQIGQAAALLTLTGGALSKSEAQDIVGRAPLLQDANSADIERVTSMLHNLYFGKSWVDGIQPDLLGEHIVATEIANEPALLDAIFKQTTTADYLSSALTLLHRLAARDARAVNWIERSLGISEANVVETTRILGMSSGEPVGRIISTLREFRIDSPIDQGMEVISEEGASNHRRATFIIAITCLEALKGLSISDAKHELLEFARNFDHLAAILLELDQPDSASDAAYEATKLYRSLTKLHPKEFEPYLARSLLNLANILRSGFRYEH